MIEATVSPEVAAALNAVIATLAPPPPLTVSEWADKFRVITQGTPVPGPWQSSRLPYSVEIMDFINDPDVQECNFMKSSQIGATEIGLNIVGYTIHYDPCNILGLFPSGKGGDGEKWSKNRFSVMVNDCPELKARVAPQKSRTSSSTISQKIFHGGGMFLAGANSPSAIASTPCRLVFIEEITSVSQNCGPQGDTISIAEARTTVFRNRKLYKSGSPSISGICLSEREFHRGDQRYFFVPCYDCGTYQHLRFEQFVWERDDETGESLPETVGYECEMCGARWNDVQKNRAVQNGEWRATAPFKNGVRSYHIWQAYSPFVRMSEIVAKFLKMKRSPDTFQVFYNTVLGKTWDDTGERVDHDSLRARALDFDISPIPVEVAVITAGVDVQLDRLEAEICGWGSDERTWSLEYHIIHGDTTAPAVWAELDDLLKQRYRHPSGRHIAIEAVAIDSGYAASAVYRFCATRLARKIFPIKGVTDGRLLTHPSDKGVRRGPSRKRIAKIWTVGTTEAKNTIAARLKVTSPDGFGYMAAPTRYPESWFRQLTSERRVVKSVGGNYKHRWVLPKGSRNEALDCRVYNLAAREFLGWSTQYINRLATRLRTGDPAAAVTSPRKQKRRVRSRGISV